MRVQPALLGTSKDFSAKYERAGHDLSEQLVDLKRNLLFGQSNRFVLRRNKAEVLDLPPKTYEPLYADMTDWEVQTHQELLASVGGGSPIKILHDMVALYQHPSLLKAEGGALDSKRLLSESSKLRAVMDKLRQIKLRGEKVIIFAYRIPMQQILATVIDTELGIKADIINGSTDRGSGPDAGSLGSQQARRTRNAMLERFRASRGFNVIILSPLCSEYRSNDHGGKSRYSLWTVARYQTWRVKQRAIREEKFRRDVERAVSTIRGSGEFPSVGRVVDSNPGLRSAGWDKIAHAIDKALES
jgi:SNF2 family DNA or RNA helicase